MTLALLIMAVGGAWAQSTLNVVEFEVPAGWATDNNPVTAADLPGFKAVTLDEAKAWTGAPAGYAMLFYAFDDNKINLVYYYNGGVSSDGTADFTKKLVFDNKSNGKFYYTATEPTEWELKPDDTGKKWILAEMPASDVELQVEYFAESNLFLSKDALADKGSISVKAGDLGLQFGDDGKSANTVTEGTAMTVTYNGTKKLLGMKVEKKAAVSLIVNPVVGQIIGSDGKNYDANATLPDGVKAVAVIAYVGSETGDDTYKNGLAIALADEADSNWSTAKSTCEGKTAITGAKWCLPSQDQWKQMFKANGDNEGSYTGLNTTITTAGGTTLKELAFYWSSSEAEPGVKAYYVNLYKQGTVYWNNDNENYNYQVRACLAF